MIHVLEHFAQINRVKKTRLVGTIGNFDGVHAAHQKIIQAVRRYAKKRKAKTVVISFKNHPHQVGAKKIKPILTTAEHKALLLDEYDIDFCYFLCMNKTMKNMDAHVFLERILFHYFPLDHIIVGYNFRFGKDRHGTPALIQKEARKRHIGCTIVRQVRMQHGKISSTRIRSLVKRGRMSEAYRLLGRPYSVIGTVYRGHGRGRKLGFPTANLTVHTEVLPPSGVYAVRVQCIDIQKKRVKSGIKYRKALKKKDLIGVVNIGFVPTFCRGNACIKEPVCEVHILDFTRNLLGKMLEISFYKRLRNERVFNKPILLCRQIEKDIQKARMYFC